MANKVTRFTVTPPKYISTVFGLASQVSDPSKLTHVAEESASLSAWLKNVGELAKDLSKQEFYHDGDVESLMRAHLGVKAVIKTKMYTKTRRTYSHSYLTITEETVS